MTKLQPVNGHLLIEPLKHEAFIASEKETYEEVGVVIGASMDIEMIQQVPITGGTKVYFDSWLAAKYPKTDGKEGEYYWLVRWEDVRAIERE